ncbi:Hypothetical protein, putative [Bodo saltans]|uniref:Uncharacterized protein n=1 Tax=Bodo saltans TaxID=75058 RepID=A0A0S4KFR2_BODSA|nr:Hypothetical protein, putative [Bodo saltans]|eukprot:CUI14491.1 Hypothetical protein, putative [Bodo saltans]
MTLLFAAQRRIELLRRAMRTHAATAVNLSQHNSDHTMGVEPLDNRLPECVWHDDGLSVGDIESSLVSSEHALLPLEWEDSEYWDVTGAAVGTQLVDGHSDIIHTPLVAMDGECRRRVDESPSVAVLRLQVALELL